jgi:hypothetical protein
MSADNGIYILKTIDGQYRVAHAQAIENIYANYSENWYDPIEVVLMWGDSKYTRDKIKAYEIAEIMERKWNGTEYGIKTFEYKKPWKYIVEDAKRNAKCVLEIIKDKNDSWSSYRKIELERIIQSS